MAAIASKLSPDWVHVAAGVGGFAGTQALDFIINVVKRRYSPEEIEVKEDD